MQAALKEEASRLTERYGVKVSYVGVYADFCVVRIESADGNYLSESGIGYKSTEEALKQAVRNYNRKVEESQQAAQLKPINLPPETEK